MKERFPQESASAETERGPKQDDIDAVYLKLSRYEAPGEEMSRVVHELLRQDGIELSVEAIQAGSMEIDGTPRDISIETDGVGSDGGIGVGVYVHDRFSRVQGETLKFSKTYRLKASQAALDARREHERSEKQARDAEERDRKDRLEKALSVFRPFAKEHLGKTLTPEDWSGRAHGLGEIFLKQGVPEGGNWTISEAEEGKRLRVTIKDAKGSVYDIFEFDAE
jgi:hypothetical protein